MSDVARVHVNYSRQPCARSRVLWKATSGGGLHVALHSEKLLQTAHPAPSPSFPGHAMKTNPVKEKLRNGQPSFGTWLSLGDLVATRVLARIGFDWLTLDIEHGAFDWSQATTIFAAIADADCVPLARVPEGSHHYI
jgi:hypothetical protein